jgi:hypothetical protein
MPPLAGSNAQLDQVKNILRQYSPDVIYFHSLPDLGVLGRCSILKRLSSGGCTITGCIA